MLNMRDVCNFELTLNSDYTVGCQYNPVTREVKSWREELAEAARHIRASTNRPLYVCMSGGVDSEIVARVFLELGIEFQALAMRHSQYTNDHEIAYVIDWCARNRVKLNYLPLDLTDFFVQGIDRFISAGFVGGVKTYSVYTWAYMMEAVHRLGGSAVMGMGEPVIRNINGVMSMEVIPYRHATQKYLRTYQDQIHFPWFFLQTPELLASYFREPIVRTFLDDPSYYASQMPETLQSLEKPILYHKYFPDMHRRPKGTGWERFRAMHPYLMSWISARDVRYANDPYMKVMDDKYFIPVADIEKQLNI